MKNKLKEMVGWAALKYIKPNEIVGVGTGSTVAYFIDALASIKHQIKGAVSSSETSSAKLRRLGIPLVDLNDLDCLDIYIDGADEINSNMQMIKGGVAALTREKIIATAAHKFICIVDSSKLVKTLGDKFPLPIEVIPMARSLVTRILVSFGGTPMHRQGVLTDNGNIIIDVYNLTILDALSLEEQINNIPGVVTVGLFARRCADLALIGSEQGVRVINQF
ncbi:ribose-5-phosphate isomerase RpiA [Sodalis sp. CWE]|uniref:ribose-5-phosphate isomerase RpiA n=1 Tax=Sodalis sp. CWE TaxID=2803816 RepID=UPI00210368DF|nr:ribose-5-phosphate isomerase RpiA [Sodalis sp. CWE]